MVLLCCFNSCKHKQFFFSIIMLKESCWHLLLHFMTEEEKILASHRCHAMHYQTPQDSLSKILSIVEPCLLACCLSCDPAAGGPPRAAARRAGLCVRKSVLRGVVGRFLQRQVALSVAGRRKHQVSSPTNVFEHDREKVGLRMVVEPTIFLFFFLLARGSFQLYTVRAPL